MLSDRIHIKEEECFLNLDPNNPFNEGIGIPEDAVYVIKEIRGEYLRFISRFPFFNGDKKATCRIDDFLLDYNHSSRFNNFEAIEENYCKKIKKVLEKNNIIGNQCKRFF